MLPMILIGFLAYAVQDNLFMLGWAAASLVLFVMSFLAER